VHRTAGGTRAPDLSGLLSYDRIGEEITDAMGAFEADVMTPLLCGQRPRQDDANPLDPFSIDCSNPLRSVSLVSLLRIAEQYHQRLNAIRHAKDQTSGSEWDERLCWTALFAPFSLRASRLEIRCLTDVAQLRAHAVELDHCVDQYAFDCVSGQCHIVGLFEKGRDVATAEIQDNGDAGWVVMQFKGYRNRTPSANAKAALAVLLQELQPLGGSSGSHANRRASFGLQVMSREELDRALNLRKPLIESYGAALEAGYDILNPEIVHRVLAAWRFALPPGLRRAWEHGATPAKAVAQAQAWMISSVSRTVDASPKNVTAGAGRSEAEVATIRPNRPDDPTHTEGWITTSADAALTLMHDAGNA
jgi:hypothetical protein